MVISQMLLTRCQILVGRRREVTSHLETDVRLRENSKAKEKEEKFFKQYAEDKILFVKRRNNHLSNEKVY